MNEDEKWMKVAISEAIKAQSEGEIPVGAVIIKHGQLIAQAHNQPIFTNDPTAHAEIQVLRKAGKILKNYRIVDTTLYVTLEPCAMCLAAIFHARVGKVIYGANDLKVGVYGSSIDLKNTHFFKHKNEIIGGVLESECKLLLQSFFQARRSNKKI
jgi:tRNA(adenine34) deaminase